MSAATVKFGLGRRVITPRKPVTLAGYFNVRPWEKILDDLFVRVAAFKQDGRWAFIIQFDLLYVKRELHAAVLRALADAGIAAVRPENTIMTATHAHTAPEQAAEGEGCDPEYIPFAVSQTVEAMREALDDMAPGTFEYGMVREHRFQFNRRFWMKNGSVITNPGKLNPGILYVEGEIDPEIPLLAARRDGKIKLLIANIVNHTDTIGGNDVSADWPGFLARDLAGRLDDDIFVIPLIGAAGNINHFDVSTDRPQASYAEAERIGRGYAAVIHEGLGKLRSFEPSLRTVGAELVLPARRPDADEIAEAEAVMARYPDLNVDGLAGANLTSEDLASGSPLVLKFFAANLLEMAGRTDQFPGWLTGIFFGPVAIASLPGEPFVEIGLALRKGLLSGVTAMAASLSNGFGNAHGPVGYIPNIWNYGRGGYETAPRSNRVAKNSADLILQAWRRLLEA